MTGRYFGGFFGGLFRRELGGVFVGGEEFVEVGEARTVFVVEGAVVGVVERDPAMEGEVVWHEVVATVFKGGVNPADEDPYVKGE